MVKKEGMICRCVPRRPRKTKRKGRPLRQAMPGVGVITPMVTQTPPVPVLQKQVREAAAQTTVSTEGGRTVLARGPRRTKEEIDLARAKAAAAVAESE
jgi:hypothetical protein